MKLIFFTRVLPLLSLALSTGNASPTDASPAKDHHSEDECHHHHCLSDHDAHEIVDRWISIFEGQLHVINETVTDDIALEDESVNFLFGLPSPTGPYVLGKEGLRGTAAFANSGSGTKNRHFEPLIIVHDCDTVVFRWQATVESTGLDPNSTSKAGDIIEFKGIDILEVEPCTKLVKASFSSVDYLPFLYQAGTKICFQKDAPEPVCSS